MTSRAELLLLRAVALRETRAFFEARGFLELDPALLRPGVPSEASLRPFPVELHRGSRAERRYLPTSPEDGLKQGMALLGRDVYQLGHAFRDGEEEGPWHRAHFRMLEWYRAEGGWEALQEDAVAYLRHLHRRLREAARAEGIALPPPLADPLGPVERVSVPGALERGLGLRLGGPGDLERLPGLARERGLGEGLDWRDALGLLLAVEVHPHLGLEGPALLTHYPAGVAAQARPCPGRPWLAQQFELFLAGVELGNCYAELTDPGLQARVFEEERARVRGWEPAPVDPAFLEALGRLPPGVAGGSLGFDRVLAVLLGEPGIGRLRPP